MVWAARMDDDVWLDGAKEFRAPPLFQERLELFAGEVLRALRLGVDAIPGREGEVTGDELVEALPGASQGPLVLLDAQVSSAGDELALVEHLLLALLVGGASVAEVLEHDGGAGRVRALGECLGDALVERGFDIDLDDMGGGGEGDGSLLSGGERGSDRELLADLVRTQVRVARAGLGG